MGRIDSNRDIYETWPLEVRQAVLDGKAVPGMTPEMVRVAMGKPTEVITRAGTPNTGDDEIWIYRTGGEEDPGMMTPNASMGGGMGGMGGPGAGVVLGTGRGGTVIAPTGTIGMGGGIGLGTGMGGMGGPVSRTPVDEREVVFRNGVVYSADPPPEQPK